MTTPAHTAASATVYGMGWLAFDYLGAAGEELYGRVAVLLVAQSLIGWRGAVLGRRSMLSNMLPALCSMPDRDYQDWHERRGAQRPATSFLQ